ncbi:eukaryotic translation initiation factor NCBP [Gossypium australe]|uniref:mRNA cap-binding protein n=1 Tax=Gossypium australe TaxID=47621 RepID=A0A5B6X2C8_9ROSI|nr:eukaryotic translation initiation factor NCBP [Gossypium australe]
MEITEKREGESNNSSKDLNNNDNINNDLTDSDGNNTSKEAEERRAPIQVPNWLLISPFIWFSHFLQHKFVFWYTRRTPGVRTQTAYEDNIKKIVDFSTVEGFWVCYCHLARPSTLPSPTDLHLFKEGIRPLWEDSANCNGGKWIIRFKKVVSGRFWEDLVRKNTTCNNLFSDILIRFCSMNKLFHGKYSDIMVEDGAMRQESENSLVDYRGCYSALSQVLALVGDQLDYGDNVCGAVLSIRFNEDILSVWNRNASDHQAVMALRDSIKRHLKLPQSYVMEYKPHDASLRDNSSYRNTWLRG